MASVLPFDTGRQVAIDAPAFAYIGNNQRSDFESLADTAGGLIFADRAGQAAAHEFRRADQQRPILFDPALYMEQRPVTVGLFDPMAQAVAVQSELSVTAFITPSSMTPASRDAATLRDIFDAGITFGDRVRSEGIERPVFTALVVTPKLLTDDLDTLLAVLSDHPYPLAIVPASRFDLFNERAHVEGVLACLEAAPGSMMMRCDLSGLGLLAHGASAVGIGTSTSTRHRALPMRSSGAARGDGQRPKTILVGPLMAFRGVDKLEPHDGDRVLVCDCVACDGESVVRYLEPGLAEEADQHTAATWRRLLDELLGYEAHQRAAAWQRMCRTAMDECNEFIERRSADLAVPRFLSAWQPCSLRSLAHRS